MAFSLSDKNRAILLLFFLAVVWGLNWPIIKIGLAYMDPLWFAVMRLVLGIAFLFPLIAVLERRLPTLPPRQDWPIVFSIGLLQMAAFMALINLGVDMVGAGRAAILSYTTPLWVAPGAALVLGEKFDLRRLIALLAGMAAIAVLVNPLTLDWSREGAIAGSLLLVLSAFCWALAILHTRYHRWTASPVQLAPWQMLVGLVPLSITAWVIEGPLVIDWTWETAWVLLYNGPLATALAFWAVVTVTRLLPAMTLAISILAVPAAGLVFSAMILGESLSPAKLAGLALISFGVVVIHLGKKGREGDGKA